MTRTLFKGSALAMLLIAPNLVWAVRYKIDPQPRSNVAVETYVTEPWTMVSFPEKSQFLTLLNFVVDQEPDPVEGVDYPKYNRSHQFGTWIIPSPNQNCYDTRAKILMRDSTEAVTFAEHNPCRVATGNWHDYYSGHDIHQAREIDIDHVVPLKNAYISGAWKWSKKRRCHYANFISYDSHLLAVSSRENRIKGDRSPARYMPPDSGFACAYLQRWLNIKAVWDLILEEDEVAVIQQLMRDHRCSVRYQTITEAALRNLKSHTERVQSRCATTEEQELENLF